LDISINSSRIHTSGLFWAIAASMLLHVLVAIFVPNFNFTSKKETLPVLKVELQQPAPPAPAPIAEPLPPVVDMPEPPIPEPIKKKPKPIIKPKPIKKEAPTPVEPPEITQPPVVDKVIAVEPTVESKSEVVVPQPPKPIDPPPPPEPSQADISSALSAYGGVLGRAIAKQKSYPKIAERRGWQGTALLDLKIDSNGEVLSAEIRESSGYDTLDKRALEMVKLASPFPAPPKELQGRTFNITVPVSFKLADG
jgi:periplasmic protein TonB